MEARCLEGAPRSGRLYRRAGRTNSSEHRGPHQDAPNAKRYLNYTVAGESGIAMANIHYEVVKP